MAVEANVPADERRVAAEPPAPEALAQDDDRVCPRREIVLRCQEPSERRLTAKHREIVPRNRQPEGELIARRNDVVVRGRPPGDGVTERNGQRSERDHACEYIVAVADVAILGDGEVVSPPVAIQRIQPHQCFRLTNRQRTQHEGVEESKRCSVDAHSQRQRRDRDGGEDRIPAKKTQSESDVLSQGALPRFKIDRYYAASTVWLTGDYYNQKPLLRSLAARTHLSGTSAVQQF